MQQRNIFSVECANYKMIPQLSTQTKIKVTILFLAYNQQDFVTIAARSCLEQHGDGIEIIFSDDFSTDNTYVILQKIVSEYTGPHQIKIRRNTKNLGIGDHYNLLVKLARGQLLITAAGDDISLPNRTNKIIDAWEGSNQQLDLIASYAVSMDYSGHVTKKIIKVDQLANWRSASSWCKKRPYVVGATHAFTKRLWEDFNDLASDVCYEDQVLTLRAMCKGGGLTIEEPLIHYREGGVSSTLHQSDPQLQAANLFKRHSRQKAIFEQIRKDLSTIGLTNLWKGKVKRYHSRSVAILYLLGQSTPQSTTKKLLELIINAGPIWFLRYLIKIKAKSI